MGPKNKSVLYLLKTTAAKVVYSCFTSNYIIFVPPAVQQLEFLEGRKKQYMKAALQAKQKNDMEQAKVFLRTAKGFDSMIEAARSGRNVDISTVSRQEIHSDRQGILRMIYQNPVWCQKYTSFSQWIGRDPCQVSMFFPLIMIVVTFVTLLTNLLLVFVSVVKNVTQFL